MRKKRPYEFLPDGSCRIDISRGMSALIDAEDFEKDLTIFSVRGDSASIRICDYRWNSIPCRRKTTYVGLNLFRGFGRQVCVRLHRLILSAKPGDVVDHKNRNGLDNRKSNLRIATNQQNAAWHKSRPGNSGFNGVHWDRHIGKWRAQTSYNKKRLHIGVFDSEIEAARAYDARAKELFGEFATLNF